MFFEVHISLPSQKPTERIGPEVVDFKDPIGIKEEAEQDLGKLDGQAHQEAPFDSASH